MAVTLQQNRGPIQVAKATVRSDERVQVLDSWRGFAMCAVFLIHCAVGTASLLGDKFSLCLVFRNLAGFGHIGLHIFFVLSGYLSTRILLQTQTSKHYYANWYARRCLRIFPLYYAFLIFCLVVVPCALGPEAYRFFGLKHGIGWLWVYGTNIYQSVHRNWCYGQLSHLWSLAVEEQFYLLWPLVVRFLPPARLTRFSVGLLSTSIILRLYFALFQHDYFVPRVFTLCNMDCIAGGAIVAILINTRSREYCLRAGKMLLAISTVALPAYFITGYGSPNIVSAFAPLATGIASCGVILHTVSQPGSCKPWFDKALAWVGRYSYGIYLVHYPILGLVLKTLPVRMTPIPEMIVVTTIVGALSLAIAYASYEFYEKRFLKLKLKFQ
jgi:peptidoglycan/LPS O-acetylase OafA/YrhL